MILENSNLKAISSREVAEMMEVRHDSLMRKIDGISTILTEHNIVVSEYWIESTYKDSTGRTLKEFQVTKKGCEMLAHKSIGEKGVIFTHRYMQKFEEMEQTLQNPFTGLSKELQAIFMIDQKQQEVQKQVESVALDFKIYKEESPLFNIECEEISRAVRKKGVEVLGGKTTKAYANKSIRGKVYSDIYHQLKRNFDVSSYKAISRKFYTNALDIIKNYSLPLALQELITQVNKYSVKDWIES